MFQPQATLVYPTFFPTTTTSQPFTTTTTPSIVNSVYDYSEPIETSRPQHIQRVNSQQQEEVRFSLGLEQTQAQTAEHQIAPSNDYPRFSNRPHTAGPLTFEQPLFTDSGAPRLFTPAISQQYPTTTASPSDFPSIASYSITQSISPYARPSSTTARSQLPYLSRKRRQNQFELNSTLGGYIRRSPRNFRPRMSASEYGDGEERLDMAREEELAREYDPTAGLTGPNVGVKKSTRLITESYADADLVYVEKTTMLPETYSHFREVIGDGVCGWRAIAFSYFESLLHLWSPAIFQSEHNRLTNLVNSNIAAHYPGDFVTDDMFPPFTTLLSQLQNIISQSPQPTQTSRAEAEELIVNTFNNDETSGPIVYLMRLFAGSRLRDEADRFVPFLEGFSSADDFCKSVIEPVSAEIEHIGITCLCETLMQPLGFAVEIIYLDRSPNELNTFVFRDENEPEKETVRSYLLYRPGHYDILYKDDGYAERQRQVQEAAARARDIQVHRAAFSPQAHGPSPMRNMSFGGVYDLGALSAIPGMSMLGITPSVCAAAPSYTSYTTYQPIMSPTYGLEQPMAMPIPVSVPSNVKLEMEAHTHSPNVTTPPSGYQVQNQGMGINNISAPIPLPVRSLSIGSVEMMTPTLGNPSQFRHSKYELETKYRSELGGGNLFIPSRVEDVEGCMGNGNGAREAQTLQTSMFRNSHYNTAHYNNPNFQPEEYNPGEDGWEVSGGVGGGRGRRKRSAS